MILLDLIDINKIRKAILYAFVIGVSLWLQLDVFSRWALPGGAKPFFIPAAVTAVGLWEGGVWGGMFGLLTGLYCDMNLTESTVTFLVLFAVFGFFSGVLAEFLINRRFVAYLLVTAAALVLTAACQTVPLWVFRGVAPETLLPVAGLQCAWSLPFAVPLYLIVKTVSGRARLD